MLDYYEGMICLSDQDLVVNILLASVQKCLKAEQQWNSAERLAVQWSSF